MMADVGDVHAYRVVAIDAASPDIRILGLAAKDSGGLSWRAGQYARFRFPGCEPRDFSIANVASSQMLEVHIRRSGSGGVSDHVCAHVGVGDPVTVEGPFGAGYFRARHGGPVLAIAGGTGLAPMKAVIEAALASGLDRDVNLYAGFRDEHDIYLERHFIDLTHRHRNFRFVSVLSDPKENSGRRSGLVGDAVAADFQLLYGHQCYMAGPPAMAAACRAMLKLKSVPDHDIFTDALDAGAASA